MPSQPCGLHRRHSRIESVVPYTSAPANMGQVYFGRWQQGRCIFPDKTCQDKPVPYWQVVTIDGIKNDRGDLMIKLVLTDMDDTLIPAGHDGASDCAIEAIHAMQAAGLHFGPVSGRQPSAMSWMFRNRSECFSTGAFCNGQVMFVDGEAVASRATDNDALMRLADYLEIGRAHV